MLVKDVEKTLTGRTELHAPLGNEPPHGVLIIGSHTEKDIPKDKVCYSIPLGTKLNFNTAVKMPWHWYFLGRLGKNA